MADEPHPTQAYSDFYGSLHELWHRKRDRAAAIEHFKAGIEANPEFLTELKKSHAGVAQVVAMRGLGCDNGIAETYTMLQTLFEQHPEIAGRR